MASLDDTVISKQNMMLLDNVTNYDKIAIDYFHTPWQNMKDLPLSWSLLYKMKKHKLLRLPSCSMEDDLDYNIYLQRLHHCLWRRWSIENFHLNSFKINPLDINWNKETDITVLYGPDFSPYMDIEVNNTKNSKYNTISFSKSDANKKKEIISDTESLHSEDSLIYSSSLDSSSSLLFDSLKHRTNSTTSKHIPLKKSLRFSEIVKKRNITEYGELKESYLQINDKIHHQHRLRKHERSHSLPSPLFYPTNAVGIDSCAIETDDENDLDDRNDFEDFIFNVM